MRDDRAAASDLSGRSVRPCQPSPTLHDPDSEQWNATEQHRAAHNEGRSETLGTPFGVEGFGLR